MDGMDVTWVSHFGRFSFSSPKSLTQLIPQSKSKNVGQTVANMQLQQCCVERPAAGKDRWGGGTKKDSPSSNSSRFSNFISAQIRPRNKEGRERRPLLASFYLFYVFWNCAAGIGTDTGQTAKPHKTSAAADKAKSLAVPPRPLSSFKICYNF
jgi:hypothetical protein